MLNLEAGLTEDATRLTRSIDEVLIQEFLNPLVLQKAPKCTGSPMLTVPVFVDCYYQDILGRTSGKCLCLTQDHFNPVLRISRIFRSGFARIGLALNLILVILQVCLPFCRTLLQTSPLRKTQKRCHGVMDWDAGAEPDQGHCSGGAFVCVSQLLPAFVGTGYVGVGSCGHSCDGRFVG